MERRGEEREDGAGPASDGRMDEARSAATSGGGGDDGGGGGVGGRIA